MLRPSFGQEIDREPAARWPLIAAGLVSSVALLAGLLLYARPGELDGPVREASRQRTSDVFELFLKGFAVASGTRTLFVVGAIVGAFIAVRWQEWRPGVALVTAIVGASLSADALKSLFDRPSPEEWVIGVEVGTAFPSGHAAVAVAAWSLIAVLAGRRLSPAIAIAVGVVAGGCSRERSYRGCFWVTTGLAMCSLASAWGACGSAQARRSAYSVPPSLDDFLRRRSGLKTDTETGAGGHGTVPAKDARPATFSRHVTAERDELSAA